MKRSISLIVAIILAINLCACTKTKENEIYSFEEGYSTVFCEEMMVSYNGNENQEKPLYIKVYNYAEDEDSFFISYTEHAAFFMSYALYKNVEDNLYEFQGLPADEFDPGPEGNRVDPNTVLVNGYIVLGKEGIYFFPSYTLEEVESLSKYPMENYCKFEK